VLSLYCTTPCSLSDTSSYFLQYDSFFREHGLSSEDYILGLPKEFTVTWVSSPEVALLKSLAGKLRNNTKLIFRFLPEDLIEPTTKITYGELLKDLKSIKAFASGILVPKNFIWPLNKDMYLEPATSLVKDAHTLGLEVYASGFANDDSCISHNYSYDPSAEYLQFIDNSDFSVDGVLTDYPPTASAAIGKDQETYAMLEEAKTEWMFMKAGNVALYMIAAYT
jgi:hypothetical protein